LFQAGRICISETCNDCLRGTGFKTVFREELNVKVGFIMMKMMKMIMATMTIAIIRMLIKTSDAMATCIC